MKISVVIPLYNEESTVPFLRSRLHDVFAKLNFTKELILVDDGSHDQTVALIKKWIAEDAQVYLIELSRNFGHQAAITAGLSQATGDAVVILDADLQDPPELIPEMVDLWKKGNKVVLAQRLSRQDSFIRTIFFNLFYKIFSLFSDLPPIHSGVFGLMDRVVVNHLLSMSEQNRYLPGLRNWIGFQTAKIEYHRDPRKTGDTKQSLRRLFKYGLDAIFSFSYKPLRFSFMAGIFISFLCFLYAAILVFKRLMGIDVVHGFTTISVAIFFLSGVILISNGILGEYIGRIYDEVKNRPLYIIARKTQRDQSSGQIHTEYLQ